MTYKTILVHCDASRAIDGRLAAAADVAQRFEARLVGLHAREPFEIASFIDGGMPIGTLMEAYQAGCDSAEKTAQSAYDKATRGRNFPGMTTRHSASAKKKSPNMVALSTPSLWGFE